MILLTGARLLAALDPPPTADSAANSELPARMVARLGEHRFVHHSRIINLFYLPAGDSLLAVTGNEACVWDVRTGNRRVIYEGRPPPYGSIMRGALSRDGKTLLLAENGPNLMAFDVATGERKAQWTAAKVRATTAALSSDGHYAASDDGSNVILWDAQQGKEIRRFTSRSNHIAAVRFSPDDRHLAIATGAPETALWIEDVAGQEAPRRLENFTGFSAWFDFAPDGRTLVGNAETAARAPYSDLVCRWNVDTGRALFTTYANSNHGAVSPDGQWVATCGLGEVTVFDVSTGAMSRKMDVGHEHIWAVAYSPDGRTLATATGQRIQLWNTETWRETEPGSGHSGPVQTLAFSPDGRMIATGSLDGSLILWSWPEGKEIKHVKKLGSSWGVQRVAFSPDNHRVALKAWVNAGDMFLLYDAAAGTFRSRFGKPHPGDDITFSADGKEVLTGQLNGSIGVWDADTGAWKRGVGHAKGTIHAAHPLPGGDLAWWAGDYQGLGLRNLRTGEDLRLLREATHHGEGDLVVAVAPDESWLAVQGRIWDLKTGGVIGAERGARSVVSPDGRLLAIANGEDILFWEPLTRRVVYHARLGTGPINALAFSPDCTVLATTVGADVLIWDLPGVLQDRRLPNLDLAPADLDSLWQALGSDDSLTAHAAAWKLAVGGERAVEFLAGKLPPAKSPSPVEIAALRASFSDPDFDVREKVARQLLDLGVELSAEEREALRRPEPFASSAPFGAGRQPVPLKPVPILRPLPERLRTSRAVMALEHSLAPSAEALLEALAQGAPEAPLTHEARVALDWVRRRGKKASTEPTENPPSRPHRD